MLDLTSSSYLIAITGREQVAQIRGKAIYRVTDVTLLPLSSQKEAEDALAAAHKALKQGDVTAGYESEHDDGQDDAETSGMGEGEPQKSGGGEEQQPPEVAALEPPKGVLGKGTSLAKSVVQDRGRFGRFAKNWLSRGAGNAAQTEKREADTAGEVKEEQKQDVQQTLSSEGTQALAGADEHEEAEVSAEKTKPDDAAGAPKGQSVIESLAPRIVRGAKLYFSTSGFFFSYDHDISGTLMQRDTLPSSAPLWKRFDKLYFWNYHLVSPLINAGQDALVLPLLQGFVGQRAFSIARTSSDESDVVAEAVQKPEEVIVAQEQAAAPGPRTPEKENQEQFLLTLISRRSIKRAGLRYLRRGIDEDGNVANNVETEQILSVPSWDTSKEAFSLLQVRGSIPLFFSQNPYSFKPVPTLFGSEATNQAAFKRHLETMARRYGAVQIASLIDKHNTEAGIGEAFEKHAKLINESGGVNEKQVGFEWFDFHAACRGMRFDQVSILIDTLRETLDQLGWIVKKDDRNIRQQTGVLRTNCMDCLDRTNVTQSAVAGVILQKQLGELGLHIDLQTDPKTQWFNTLWADNGDAISKQYAGTAALKGDFTRTRKRNWTGALSDFSLSVNRYYNNILGDYFLQVCIDFYLGNVNASAFEDYETNMMSQDYALDIRRVRQNAIDTCMQIVLEDPDEDFVAGWTLSCPHEANTLRSLPFEECVVLLTDAALYFCRFDWDAEKVGSYERVDLIDITELWRGAYIISTLNPAQTDEAKNVGFALRYNTHGKAIVRTNTRSMGNEKAAADENEGKDELEKQKQPEKDESRLLAFKALPPKSSAAKGDNAEISSLTETELTRHVCDELHKLMSLARRRANGHDHLSLDKAPEVEEKDVISIGDARKSTGYMESIGYSLKKLVWA